MGGFAIDISLCCDGYIDMEKLDPIGRLNGFSYSRLGEIMERKFEDGQPR